MPALDSTVARRRRNAAWELRGSVTEDTFDALNTEAEHYGRSRTWHIGLVLEAYRAVVQVLSAKERAQLDHLLRHPAELVAKLRRLLEL